MEATDPPQTRTPIHGLPQDTLHNIFSYLSLREIVVCRSVCKFFNQAINSPSFLSVLSLLPPLSLIALRPRHASFHQSLHAYDAEINQWLRLSLDFLPFRSTSPVASSPGLLYLWAGPHDAADPNKSLVLCNPISRRFRVLPPLGSAWCRHGTVLPTPAGQVLVLSELAVLYFAGSGCWQKFSSNLSSKPRSPILVSDSVFALCDVGSPWRSQWKLFCCKFSEFGTSQGWNRLEKHEWGDVFDILKRPRLIRGIGNQILMVGGLKSSFSLNATCSTILILRLDLDTLEWDEAGRMPQEMFRSFQECSKFKVFGGEGRVCISAKRVGKLTMWDCLESGKGGWRWIEGVPGCGEWLCRGFAFEAGLTDVP